MHTFAHNIGITRFADGDGAGGRLELWQVPGQARAGPGNPIPKSNQMLTQAKLDVKWSGFLSALDCLYSKKRES